MLADEILNHLQTHQNLMNFCGSDYLNWLASQIRRAPRYVLTQSALEVVISIAQTRLSSVEKAYPLIRTPEPIWIEYAYQDEFKARQVIGARATEVTGLRRAGFLAVPDTLECKQLSIFFCVSYGHPADSFQYFYLRVNLERPWTEQEIPDNVIARPFGRDPEKIMKNSYWGPENGWKDSDRDAAAFLIRHSFVQPLPGTETAPWMQRMSRPGAPDFDPDLQASSKIAYSTIIPFATMMALLRTRNKIEMEESDLTTLNKARVKSGKAKFLDYSTVKVSLTKDRHVYRREAGAGGTGLSPEARRACLVEAHYKVRKTGIFLWHAHPRRGFGTPNPKTFSVVE